jgi:hypothetical protein
MTLKAWQKDGNKEIERVNEWLHFGILECQRRRPHGPVDDVPGDADSCSINASVYPAG